MRKLKYFFKLIKETNKKTKKGKIVLFFDILLCKICYKASFKDYDYFDMVNLTSFERKTVITSGINKEYIKKYNNPKQVKKFSAMLFTKTFEKYLKQDELELKQCTSLLELCPNSLNTIVVIMLLGQVVVAYLQVGKDEKLLSSIEVETGVVTTFLYDKNKNSFPCHPNSQKEVKDFVIPNWEKVILLSEQIALEIPTMGYVSFEIAIEESKCYLINGSLKPNHYYYRIDSYKNNIGLLPLFKKKEERNVKE